MCSADFRLELGAKAPVLKVVNPQTGSVQSAIDLRDERGIDRLGRMLEVARQWIKQQGEEDGMQSGR